MYSKQIVKTLVSATLSVGLSSVIVKGSQGTAKISLSTFIPLLASYNGAQLLVPFIQGIMTGVGGYCCQSMIKKTNPLMSDDQCESCYSLNVVQFIATSLTAGIGYAIVNPSVLGLEGRGKPFTLMMIAGASEVAATHITPMLVPNDDSDEFMFDE